MTHSIQRHIATIIATACSLMLAAQEALPDTTTVATADSSDYVPPVQRNFNALEYSLNDHMQPLGDSYHGGKFFFATGAGLVQLNRNADYHTSLAPTLQLAVGLKTGRLSSWRIAAAAGMNRMEANKPSAATATSTLVGGNIDYLLSLSNYLLGYRPERPLDVSLALGGGLLYASLNNQTTTLPAEGSHLSWNARAGLQLKFYTGPHTALAIEPYALISTDHADLAQNSSWRRYQSGWGVSLSYLYYLNDMLTPRGAEGRFEKHFGRNDRAYWHEISAPRSLFVFHSTGGSLFTTFDGKKPFATLGLSYHTGLGWYMSPAMGIRAGLLTTTNRWRNGGDSERVRAVATTAATFDLLLNPFALGRSSHWDRQAGINLVGGLLFGESRYTRTDLSGTDNTLTLGLKAGMQLWVRTERHTRLYLEPAFTHLQYDQSPDHRSDNMLGVNAGIEVLLASPSTDLQPKRDNYIKKFYVALGGGWNTTQMRWMQLSGSSDVLKNISLAAGYHFSPAHALRIGEEMLTNQLYNDTERKRYTYWMTSADYQLSISQMLAKQKSTSRWDLSVMAGPTVAIGHKKASVGANVGYQLDYHISRKVGLYYNHTLYLADKDLYPAKQTGIGHLTAINSHHVGLTYQFNDAIGPMRSTFKAIGRGLNVMGQGATAIGREAAEVGKVVLSPFAFVGRAIKHEIDLNKAARKESRLLKEASKQAKEKAKIEKEHRKQVKQETKAAHVGRVAEKTPVQRVLHVLGTPFRAIKQFIRNEIQLNKQAIQEGKRSNNALR